MNKKKTKEKFTEDSLRRHGKLYDYSKVDYQGSHTKVIIVCEKHGEFLQTPSNHLRGQGCSKCATERQAIEASRSTNEFIDLAISRQGIKYDYSKVVYSGCFKKVVILCPIHGEFKQAPSAHLDGSGCPACATTGYQVQKSGYLYVLRCGDITKIGITNLTPEHRTKDISRSFGATFEVVRSWFFDEGRVPDAIETMLLRELRTEYERPTTKFEGSSECFLNVDYNRLVSRIEEEIFS